jgi:hypothetical protein
MLGVFPLRHELSLFFKRYDRDSDLKLRFSEFCDAFLPKDKIYADHLNTKRANTEARRPEDAFSVDTKLELSEAFKKHLKCEGQNEDIR